MTIGPLSNSALRPTTAARSSSVPEGAAPARSSEPSKAREPASQTHVEAARNLHRSREEQRMLEVFPFLRGVFGINFGDDSGIRKPCGTGGKCISIGLRDTKGPIG